MAIESLHKSDDAKSVRTISDELEIPFDSVAHVLQKLAKAQLVEAKKGVQGGYQLNKEIKNLSFLKLTELIEGKKFFTDCITKECNYIKSCNIQDAVNTLNNKTQKFFNNISIKEILEGVQVS